MWGPVEPQGRKKDRGKRDDGQEREEALRFAEEILASDQKDLRSVLYRDILLNALKAKRDELDILDLKVINRAMAEFRYAARVFKPYRGVRKVSIFGSAREKKGHPYYELAVRLGRLLVGKGFMVITGAAEGIMRAGIEGAGPENSFGVNILLPFEKGPAKVIHDDPKVINFRYFFTRKVFFVMGPMRSPCSPADSGRTTRASRSSRSCRPGRRRRCRSCSWSFPANDIGRRGTGSSGTSCSPAASSPR